MYSSLAIITTVDATTETNGSESLATKEGIQSISIIPIASKPINNPSVNAQINSTATRL